MQAIGPRITVSSTESVYANNLDDRKVQTAQENSVGNIDKKPSLEKSNEGWSYRGVPSIRSQVPDSVINGAINTKRIIPRFSESRTKFTATGPQAGSRECMHLRRCAGKQR